MFIIAIDIDGTIQGDITPQVNEYTLINKIGLKYNKNYLQEDYLKGLLRPFFANFIEVFKKKQPQVELFIYTITDFFFLYHINRETVPAFFFVKK